MPSPLERHEAKYRALAAQVAQIGFISPGSLVTRTTSCGKPGCRCQADPPHRHGPYHQWSRAVAGKTISRRLTDTEADLYRTWIANRRQLERIIAQMEQVSAAAGEILLRQATTTHRSSRPKR
jgi:hypothetical protein